MFDCVKLGLVGIEAGGNERPRCLCLAELGIDKNAVGLRKRLAGVEPLEEEFVAGVGVVRSDSSADVGGGGPVLGPPVD